MVSLIGAEALRPLVGSLTPFLDDVVLAAVLMVAVLWLAPAHWGWALLGLALALGAKAWLLRAHFRKPAMGPETMRGRVAKALDDLAPRGQVSLDGEIWEAEATAPVRRGEQVQVQAMEGLLLRVAPLGVMGEVRAPPRGSVLLGLAEKLRRE